MCKFVAQTGKINREFNRTFKTLNWHDFYSNQQTVCCDYSHSRPFWCMPVKIFGRQECCLASYDVIFTSIQRCFLFFWLNNFNNRVLLSYLWFTNNQIILKQSTNAVASVDMNIHNTSYFCCYLSDVTV